MFKEFLETPVLRCAAVGLAVLVTGAGGIELNNVHTDYVETNRNVRVHRAAIQYAQMVLTHYDSHPGTQGGWKTGSNVFEDAVVLQRQAKDVNSDRGMVAIQVWPQRQGVYDPNDVMFTTVRATLHDSQETNYSVGFENAGHDPEKQIDDNWIMMVMYSPDGIKNDTQFACYGNQKRCKMTDTEFADVSAQAFGQLYNILRNDVEPVTVPAKLQDF